MFLKAETACSGPTAHRPRRARGWPLYRPGGAHYECFKQVYDERGFARVRCEACRRKFRVALLKARIEFRFRQDRG